MPLRNENYLVYDNTTNPFPYRIRCVGTRYVMASVVTPMPCQPDGKLREEKELGFAEKQGVFYSNLPSPFIHNVVGWGAGPGVTRLARREPADVVSWDDRAPPLPAPEPIPNISPWMEDWCKPKYDYSADLPTTLDPRHPQSWRAFGPVATIDTFGSGAIRFLSRHHPIPPADDMTVADHLFFGYSMKISIKAERDRLVRLCDLDGQGQMNDPQTPMDEPLNRCEHCLSDPPSSSSCSSASSSAVVILRGPLPTTSLLKGWHS